MKTYEYKVLEETDTTYFTLEDINKLGKKGWRVVNWIVSVSGRETVLLELEKSEEEDLHRFKFL